MAKRRLLLLLLMACGLVAVPAARALAEEPDLDAPLPFDPAIRMVQLPNGLECWLRQHATPPDRLAVWMHVGSGSLNEADDQRGLAHFLEHMAFNGSENFPPGELVKYFESIGLRFGQHQNAFTGFDQTVYTLALPDTKRDTTAKGMLCMSDYAFRLSLLPEEVQKEKGVVLEEIRARKGPGQRIIEKLLPIILPGSRVAERLPIGKEEVIEDLDAQQVREYYETWYRPDNTTVLVVGDAELEMVEESIREQFAGWEPVQDPPAEADPGVSPYETVRAAVITDPEAVETEVSAVSVRPLEPLKTVGDFRRNLVDELGAWIVNRRLLEMLQKGEAPFQEAEVEKSPFLNTCTYIDATATGKPDAWRDMLRALLTELKRARVHGFLAQELDNARKAFLANARQAERIEATRDARSFLRQMNSAIARDRKPMSAGQRLELVEALIPAISVEEVTAAFRRNFQPDARLLLVIMPEREDLVAPAESELLALAREVGDAEVAPPEEKVMRESLLEEEPAPGSVTDREEEPDLGILSVTLNNGVRAHLRHMDFKENQVFIKATVGGGIIRETAANRGMTGLAAQVFDQPASSTLSSTEVQDLLTGKNVSLGGGAVEDAVQVSLTSSTQDVESAFQLAHMVLTDPRLEQSAVDRWKEQMLQTIERRRVDVGDRATEAMQELLSGGDVRFQFPTEEQVQALTRERAQGWLEELLREGPLEVAVVGDLERERALELTLKHFGSLPDRPFTNPSLEALRGLHYREGPLTTRVEVETITPRAVVLSGWRGADWTDVKDRRILQIVAQILTSRLREEVREARGLTYSIWCIARPSRGYEGAGLFTVWFTADPGKALEAADLARGLVEEFAAEGPTDEELSAVRKQFKNSIETSQKEPTYWVSVLGELDYRGTVLSDVKEALEKYTSYTREEMLDVMSRYVVPERRLQAVALPKPPEEDASAEETPTED